MNSSGIATSLWIKVFIILAIESVLVFFIFDAYPGFSMLFLGEGANSALYSNGNVVAWVFIPILIPSVFNLNNILVSLGSNQRKLDTFKFVQIILMILYVIFIIWWGKTKSFHI
jgi:hypothetical protein